DAWDQLGDQQKRLPKRHLRWRAYQWYEKALPQLTGINGDRVRRRQHELTREFFPEFTNSLGMTFVIVPRGTFWMSKDGKNAQRQVEIANNFYIGKYLVTQGQWQAVTGKNPSSFSRSGPARERGKNIPDPDLKQFPVEMVNFNDVQQFLKLLNARDQQKGWVYRLPTEAEWEYACRAAACTKEECSFDFYLDKPGNALSSKQANFNGDVPAGGAPKHPRLGRASKVGSYPPNGLGLYDMHGNVWQWCGDLFDGGPDRVIRGGSWSNKGSECRAAVRARYPVASGSNMLGFRLARVPSGN